MPSEANADSFSEKEQIWFAEPPNASQKGSVYKEISKLISTTEDKKHAGDVWLIEPNSNMECNCVKRR